MEFGINNAEYEQYQNGDDCHGYNPIRSHSTISQLRLTRHGLTWGDGGLSTYAPFLSTA